MNIYIRNAVILLALLSVAYGSGRYLQPAKVVVKTETVTKEVEVVKRDVQVIVKEVRAKDGTVTVETTTIDKSTESTDKSSLAKTSKEVTNTKPQWKASLFAISKDSSLANPAYGAIVERRILGPIHAGLYANTDKQFGVSIGLEF